MPKIALFTGIETFNWKLSDFDAVISFCKQHFIDRVFVKVYEYEAGEWYNGHSETVVNYIDSKGIECIPYGFFYGGTQWDIELAALTSMYKKFTGFCLDLEGDWDNNANGSIDALKNFLASQKSVDTFISTWANVTDHGWISNIQTLDPYVWEWLPQEYNDNLIQLRLQQWPKCNAPIIPTYCVNQVSPDLVAITDYPSLWEYQGALVNELWIDSFIQHVKGGLKPVIKNNSGSVLDIPFSYQLEPGESEDLCGNFCVAMLAYAGPPNKGTTGNAEQVDILADTLATLFEGGPINEQGSTIPDMFNYLEYPKNRAGQRLLHYQEIPAQDALIKLVVNAGYCCIVTANELNIRSTKTGAQPPYPWTINANHILLICGIDSAGNYIVADPLNNNFEGEWPVHYDASVLAPSWACIVRLVGQDANNPLQLAIPNPDVTKWNPAFNAQNFTGGVQVANTTYDFNVDVINKWQLVVKGLPRNTGIFKAFQDEIRKGNYPGSPEGPEVSMVDTDNVGMVLMPSNKGTWKWKNGKIETWNL